MDKVALQKCSYGVYVVCSKSNDGKFNGQIVNTVFQVTTEPPRVTVSINKGNLTHDFIKASKVFTVSILSEEAPMQLIGRFGFKSGRAIEKLDGIKYKIGVTGAPVVLEFAVSYIECNVVGELDVGTHTIFVGEMIDAEVLKGDAPMTYEYYHKIKGGKSPKAAPTYVQEEANTTSKPKEEADKMTKYRCKICGYIYDPEQGDSASGIKPGTAFEDLPDSWVCPICGAPKSEFEKVS